MRAHFNRALLDLQGNQIASAQVRLLVPGGTDLYASTIYTDVSGGGTRPNPWTTDTGEVDFYLDAPDRVRIGIRVGTAPEEFWDNIDVLGVGNDSTHPGNGAGSLQIGLGAVASGLDSTALGPGGQAVGDQSTALGEQASASEAGTVAAGSQASASQPGAVAVGQSSEALGSQSTALGAGARARYDQSTALGAGAETDRPGQVAVGTVSDLVDIPGTTVLHSPDGSGFAVKVTNDGMLYAQRLPAYEEPPVVEEGGGDGTE